MSATHPSTASREGVQFRMHLDAEDSRFGVRQPTSEDARFLHQRPRPEHVLGMSTDHKSYKIHNLTGRIDELIAVLTAPQTELTQQISKKPYTTTWAKDALMNREKVPLLFEGVVSLHLCWRVENCPETDHRLTEIMENLNQGGTGSQLTGSQGCKGSRGSASNTCRRTNCRA